MEQFTILVNSQAHLSRHSASVKIVQDLLKKGDYNVSIVSGCK